MNNPYLTGSIPVPRDLMLPLPLFEEHLKILLVVFFLLHILFVNLMVGGVLQTLLFEILGLKNPKYDGLAKKIADTVTVNKSLAVVLGIGPLLCISLLYTPQFYTANALTGHAWFALIPLITAAFLLTYLHKYSWDKFKGKRKVIHLMIGAAAGLFFLFIPLIFLTNINLMLFPARWDEVRGFFSSLKIGNVFPRYFHFLMASNAVTGLFLAGWLGRASSPVITGFTHASLRRMFYEIVLYVTFAQFIFGPLVLFTLPVHGISVPMLAAILSGAVIAGFLLYFISREIIATDETIGRHYWLIVGIFSLIVVLMGTGRHLYRESSLFSHMQLVKRKTQEFRALEVAADMRIKAGFGIGEDRNAPSGKTYFTQNCAACHSVDAARVGPPLTEIARIYGKNAPGIVAWAKAPGWKRKDARPMPPMGHLGEDKLKSIAEYMLSAGEEEKNKKV